MALKLMKKYIAVVIAIFAVIYLWSYSEVRRSHLLVHTSSFSANSDGIKLTYSHGVCPTDAIRLLQPRLSYTVFFAQLIYSPLMLGEVIYWYIVEPRDSIWQYKAEYDDTQQIN